MRLLRELRAAWRFWRAWTTGPCPICGHRVANLAIVDHVRWHAEFTPASWRRWVDGTRR